MNKATNEATIRQRDLARFGLFPMPVSVFFAHSRDGEPECTWEPLLDHLDRVADLAKHFSEAFGAAEWGYLAGLWHDIGKYSLRFQARLRGSPEAVEHSGIGAALANSKGAAGRAIAFAIAGHHAGLANNQSRGDSDIRSLRERIEDNLPELEVLRPVIPPELLDREVPDPPAYWLSGAHLDSTKRDIAVRRIEFWTRFLFSALVDADRLATEEFYDPGRRRVARNFMSIPELSRRLDRHLEDFRQKSAVDRTRGQVLDSCRAAADQPQGIFSLTVPTGGGKTLSSMAFALRHAERHGLRRVIVVIPYTSIIEQNAEVYRNALGVENVVEHHSNIDEATRLEDEAEQEIRRRLATENWDAPVVVTTNVQFFESLFANHPSRCRKLHNIARSAIIFDEAQNLPEAYLNCILDAMSELVGHYGCSLVLMTATQPALQRREAMPFGLADIRSIVPDPNRLALARELDRVRIHWPEPVAEPVAYEAVAEDLVKLSQVLAIVHTRKDARLLAEQLPREYRFHLSALMCAAHRSAVLSRVKVRLRESQPCRLVATQLVEAGVDIDFPVVYRALAGLDALAQAAGRCNREGRLRDGQGNPRKGQFHVFRAATRPPPGILRLGLETMEALLKEHGGRLSFMDEALFEKYFRMLYMKCDTDKNGVQTERSNLNFATVAQRVRLIEDGFTRPVVVPWEDSTARVEAYRNEPSRETQRALQAYVVQIPERELSRLTALGALERLHDRVDVLTSAYSGLYHHDFGLIVDEAASADPEAFIV